MDLIVVIILTIGMGMIKINQFGSYDGAQSFVSSDVSTSTVETSTVPIGNNLMLLRENHAFEKILIELGLGGR